MHRCVVAAAHQQSFSGQSHVSFPLRRDEGHGPNAPCRSIWYASAMRSSASEADRCPLQVLERFFSRRERQRLFHSWAGSASMWMKVASLSHNLVAPTLSDITHNYEGRKRDMGQYDLRAG